MTRAHEEERGTPRQSSSGLSVVARAYWMLFGYGAAAASAAWVSQSGPFPAAADAVFWASVLALSFVRYVDIAFLGGETAEGDPATLHDWRKYSLIVAGVALATWAGVRGLELVSPP